MFGLVIFDYTNESSALNIFLIAIAAVCFFIPPLYSHILITMSLKKFVQKSEATILNVLQNSCCEKFILVRVFLKRSAE